MRQAVIVSYARTGLAKAGRGGFNNTSNMTILGHAIEHAVKRSGVDPAEVEDVIAGCVAARATSHAPPPCWPACRSPPRA
jgi:acetyl-CoA C-acetyltransferase